MPTVKVKGYTRNGKKVKGHTRVVKTTISHARRLAKKKRLSSREKNVLDGFKSTSVLGRRADSNFKTSHQLKILRRKKK